MSKSLNDNKNATIESMTFDQILDYLYYKRECLVLPSASKENFEAWLSKDISNETWKIMIPYILSKWYKYGDEGFLDSDFMSELKELLDDLVCKQCGSKNVNEERIVSISLNDNTIKSDQHIDYYCDDCKDITQIVRKDDLPF